MIIIHFSFVIQFAFVCYLLNFEDICDLTPPSVLKVCHKCQLSPLKISKTQILLSFRSINQRRMIESSQVNDDTFDRNVR